MVKLLPTQLTAAMQNCKLEKESFQGTILEDWQVICKSTHVLCLCEDSAMDCAALKAAIVLPALLLQKPHAMSKAKDHSIHLECRIKLWENGYIIWKGKRHLGAPKGTRTFIESYVQKLKTVSKWG